MAFANGPKGLAQALSISGLSEVLGAPWVNCNKGKKSLTGFFNNVLFLKNFRQFCSSRNWRLFTRPIWGGLIPSVSCKRSSEKSYSPIMGHRTGSIGCRAEAKEKLSRIMRLSLDQALRDGLPREKKK